MIHFTPASERVGWQPLRDYLNKPEVEAFINRLVSSGDDELFASFTFPAPAFDPLAALEMLSQKNEFKFYWEKPDQQVAFSAGEKLIELRTSGPRRFKEMACKVREVEVNSTAFSMVEHSLAGIHLLGGFSFFDEIKNSDWDSFGPASLTIPQWLLIKDGKFGLLTVAIKVEPDDTKTSITGKLESRLQKFDELYRMEDNLLYGYKNGSPSAHHSEKLKQTGYSWIKTIEEAKSLIRKNAFEKIVLARQVTWESELPVAPTLVLNTLRNEYPSCYNFLIQNAEGKAFIGCSPERLVSFQKNYVLTESLAGSSPRGKTATEDLYWEKHLLNSVKNRKEHHYVTRAIEKRLRPFTHKIENPAVPEVKKLKNVQHLFTPVTGWLKKDAGPFNILEQLHPTPAVGGYPREQAIPYIKQLESFDRGWYAGPVGWFNLNGGGEFAVAIRSGLIGKNNARLFAGCGIVEDSDAYAEWEETNLKLMPILSAFGRDGVTQTE